ncbi:GntR family transcriptional regulator (plasmid) [Cupriavidus pinatubonensis]|uniref:GntR family transcriptional regulator n=1 Tax=Cupriavidus pinatubonensis TaxID=248026 RepID=UPI001C73403E|nr:GntR family transcriptional regulator [Cupriavidus pinatubonensis]QYY33800.1 GntR family transcriptional regulator [Cupriavidus pinatubonensis]
MARYTSLIREDRPRVRETNPPKRAGLTVNELYEELKSMAVLYTIRPGERVNELELADRFNVSRTPLREALNRLVAENLLTFVPNRGFFVRELNRQDIFDLFELRRSIEASAVQLAVERADDKDIRALRKFWKDVMKNRASNAPAAELVTRDEEFHVRLVALSGNNEMVRAMYGINARIHFVRWVDIEQRGHDAFAEHLDILDAIEARDAARVRQLTETHITWRMEEIASVVDAGVVKLFSR